MFALLLFVGLIDRLFRFRPWMAVGLSALVLASWLPAPLPASSPASPRFFSPTVISRIIPSGSVVLVLPYSYGAQSDLAMWWQVNSDMAFKMPEGYFSGSSLFESAYGNRQVILFVRTLRKLDFGITPKAVMGSVRQSASYFLRRNQVSWIVVGPNAYEPAQVRVIRKIVGSNGTHIGGVVLFRVQTS